MTASDPNKCGPQITTTELPNKTNTKILPTKGETCIGPSPLRQLLPIAVCLISFATVFSILIIYMDTTGKQNKFDTYFVLYY